jgi:hypothetical protein
MADVQKEIALKVTTDLGQTTAQFQSATKELQETQKALVELALAGKQGSEEFLEMENRAGQLRDAIGSVNQRVNTLASSTPKLDLVKNAAQGIAGGFAAAQGAAALFGDENEDIQKAILKTQGAMALLNGVQQVSITLDKNQVVAIQAKALAQRAYALAVGQSTGAMKLFRIALLATGIGALIVAIGLLAANWEKITAAINPASKALKDYNKESAKAEELSKKRAAATDLEIRRLKALGVEELELMRIKRAAVEQEIKDTDRQLAAQQKALELSIEKFASQQADVAKGKFGAVGQIITNFFGVSAGDIVELSAKLDEVKQLRKELGVEVLEIDSDITKEIDSENGKRIQQQITALENQKAIAAAAGQDIFQLDVEIAKKRIQLAKETNGDIAKAEADLQVILITERIKALALQEELSKITKETEDKKVEARKAAQKQLDDINNEIRRSQLTEFQREQEDFLAQRAKMLELMKATGVSEVELQLFNMNTTRLAANNEAEHQEELRKKRVQSEKEAEDAILANKKQRQEENVEMTFSTLQSLASLANTFAGESEEQQKRAFNIQKAVNIAIATIETYLAAQKAYTSQIIPLDPTSVVRASIAAGVAILSGLARVAAIKKTQFKSTASPTNTGSGGTIPSGGGGGQQQVPGVFNPNVTPTTPTGQPNPMGQGQQPLRAYVVDRDIENASSRRNMLRDFAAI